MVERSSTAGGATATDHRFELDVHAQRVLFGAGRVDDVPEEVDALGTRRLLLVSTRSAKQVADRLAERLGPRVVARVHEVVQHVPAVDVADVLDAAASSSADGIVTLGGGSATGLGKAVAVRARLPLVAVPTTYSGSEATPVYGITGEHKQTARDEAALPRVVVYDPELSTSMPRHVTATSGLNAVAHCVEALYARGANPVTDLLATEAIGILARALPAAAGTPQDLDARSDALYGAYLAGWSMASAGTGLHHTLCHVLGGTHSVGHGELHAVLLPYVAAYNAPAAPRAMAATAQALGTAEAPAGLRHLAEQLGAPRDLQSLGVPADALDDVVDRVVKAVADRNPRRVEAPSLRLLLDDAYAGRPPGSY